MWMLVLGKVLGFVPGMLTLGNTLVAKHYDAKVQEYQTRWGTTRDVAVAAIQAQSRVAEKWWFVALGPAIMQISAAFYIGKSLVWDMALHLGTTDTIKDPSMKWAFVTIVGGSFAHVVVDKFINGAKQ